MIEPANCGETASPVTTSECTWNSGIASIHAAVPLTRYRTVTAAVKLSPPVIGSSMPSAVSVGGSSAGVPT